MGKRDKIFTHNSKRERLSNFVVDLRSLGTGVGKTNKLEKKSLKQYLIHQLSRFQTIVKEIKPNLLSNSNLYNPSSVSQGIKSRFINLKLKKLIYLFSFTQWRELFATKAKFRNIYFKLMREQEQIFSAPPHLNYNWWKKSTFKEKKFRSNRSGKNPWRHPLVLFALALILIILLFVGLSQWPVRSFSNWKARITGHSTLAVNNLIAATNFASQLNFKEADINFQRASANFLVASDSLNKINSNILFLASLSNNPKIKLVSESKKFITAGLLASSLGRNLMLASNSLFKVNSNNLPKILDNFLFYGQRAVNSAQELKQSMNQIDPTDLPVNYRPKFISLKNQVNLLADNLTSFVKVGEDLKKVLGLSRDKRYLLVFQNNAEMRASGGFIGSYALVDLRAGKIINLEVPAGGSYDTAGGMEVNVVAPRPLWLVNPLWHFWDANWWPDWPTTAKNLMWFYEKSGGPTVDGVIGVTPTVVQRLLKITGPINLQAQYGLTITADNFWSTVQNITEQKNLLKTPPRRIRGFFVATSSSQFSLPLHQGLGVNSAHKPKKIIGDLMAKIMEILPQKLTKHNLLTIINGFQQDLSEKQILFYFTNPSLENMALRHNWAGKVQNTSHDYLLVLNTNIAGQKSDRVISQKINETSEVEKDGTIIDTLQIMRTHHGIKNTPLTGVRNVDWLRVYVPLGSKLLSASGFRSPASKYLKKRPQANWQQSPLLAQERAAHTDSRSGTKIYQETGKTVFANWSILDPGQTIVITLRYRLPFNFFQSSSNNAWLRKLLSWLNPSFTPPIAYSLMVQKQPGAVSSEFTSRLILPANWSIFWRYPQTLLGSNTWKIRDKLDADKYYVVLLKRVIKS